MKKLFGKRLRELRIQKGYTQERMSELICIKPENYCRIENGLSFPKPENIEKISKILNVAISELFIFEHLQNYQTILSDIENILYKDKETSILVYKFLKSIGKI